MFLIKTSLGGFITSVEIKIDCGTVRKIETVADKNKAIYFPSLKMANAVLVLLCIDGEVIKAN